MYACFDRERTSAAQCCCAAAFPIKERVVTVGDGYFLTFSIQHFLFSLYEKSWYLTVTDCHSLF